MKRPPNMDYLNKLSQPKSKDKYIIVKEGSSSSASAEESEEDQRQKEIREQKEERRMYKKGVDFAQLISRESPRDKKIKKSKMKETLSRKKPNKNNIASLLRGKTPKSYGQVDEKEKLEKRGSQQPKQDNVTLFEHAKN